MAITKHLLDQYGDLKKEKTEIRDQIKKIESEIAKTEKRLEEIETGEHVKDKVRGGPGGNQSFNIEGIPVKEYERKKTSLYFKKLLLNKRKIDLEKLEIEIIKKTDEVETFISEIDDSRMRRIIRMRFIDNMSWNKVADNIGGGNTEDSIKKAFQRFLKQESCPICPEKK